MTVYVVAVSQSEAAELAEHIGRHTRAEAESHLAEVKAPPTDPFYAAQYRVFEVSAQGEIKTGETT